MENLLNIAYSAVQLPEEDIVENLAGYTLDELRLIRLAFSNLSEYAADMIFEIVG